MKCSQPFMRDHSGKIRWSTKMTEEERLACTPFPCGNCLPCRINKARTWQHRIMLEARSHLESSFITLTYDDDHLPRNARADPELRKKHLQNYFKRLRKRINQPFRYFAVGEYGDKSGRPHYHACLFGLGRSFGPDVGLAWCLEGLPIGITHIGDVTPESARYIAGYTLKKLTRATDPRLYGRSPEFMLSSRRGGGIGLGEVKRIASVLRSNPYFDVDQVVQQFTIGGKQFPLGQYLTSKLLEELGTSEVIRKEKLLEWQQKIFNENNIDTDEYYFNIISKSDQYRKNLEKKHKIFTKGKTL